MESFRHRLFQDLLICAFAHLHFGAATFTQIKRPKAPAAKRTAVIPPSAAKRMEFAPPVKGTTLVLGEAGPELVA